MRYFFYMNFAARIATPLVLAVLLLAPALAFAQPVGNPAGTPAGDPSRDSSARSPFSAYSVNCSSATICGVADTIIFLINDVAVPVLFAIAFIVFLYGVFKSYIWSRGDETAAEEGHKLILWGLIGFAVMISIWGIVNVVTATFGIRSDIVPRWPRSYYE